MWRNERYGLPYSGASKCFGTQSATGSRFVERLLSVRATCAQQGRNLFAFLTEAVMAAWRDRPAPLLVPIP